MQICGKYYVFHRFENDLNRSKIKYGLQFCMGNKPVAHLVFQIYLRAMQIRCLFISFLRAANQYKIYYFLLLCTWCKSCFKYHVFCNLHASQTCCKFYVSIKLTREEKLLQISYLPKICNRFAPFDFAANTTLTNDFHIIYMQTFKFTRL